MISFQGSPAKFNWNLPFILDHASKYDREIISIAIAKDSEPTIYIAGVATDQNQDNEFFETTLNTSGNSGTATVVTLMHAGLNTVPLEVQIAQENASGIRYAVKYSLGLEYTLGIFGNSSTSREALNFLKLGGEFFASD